mgnify:FL=1
MKPKHYSSRHIVNADHCDIDDMVDLLLWTAENLEIWEWIYNPTTEKYEKTRMISKGFDPFGILQH